MAEPVNNDWNGGLEEIKRKNYNNNLIYVFYINYFFSFAKLFALKLITLNSPIFSGILIWLFEK